MFEVWILYFSEGPFRSPTVEPKDVFNWTATYRRDSDIPIPYGRWVYYDERVKQNARLDHNYAANKTKKASCTVAVLLLIIRYRNVFRNPVCSAAWHPRHNILF
jgi:glycoprotein 3-alpha-L-fucosyltransferase